MLDVILIVVVVLLIFGGGKLREAGSDLGAAVKGVRKALRGKVPAVAARGATAGTANHPRPGVQPDAEFPEESGVEAPATRENRHA